MKIIKPFYYDQFHCIAGDCEFTCCRDWDIFVDAKTRKNWDKLRINTKNRLKSCGTGHVIRLKKDGVCPYLREDRLCSLVVRYGEGILSKTCHTFPREKHVFGDRIEYTITMGCPEAVRLLLGGEKFSVSVENVKISGSESQVRETEPLGNANPALLLFRDLLCELVQNEQFSIAEALRIAFFLALDLKESKNLKAEDSEAKNPKAENLKAEDTEAEKPEAEEPEAETLKTENLEADKLTKTDPLIIRIRTLFQPSNLSELQTAMKAVPRDSYEHICEQNEVFLDLAENYRAKGMYREILEPLAERAEYYEDPSNREEFLSRRALFENVWKQKESSLRLLFSEELYSTLYMPEGTMDSILIKLEWLGILYASLKQAQFLCWDLINSVNDKMLQTEPLVNHEFQQTESANYRAQQTGSADQKVLQNEAENHKTREHAPASLPQNRFIQTTVLLIRMMGYSEEDIAEYLADHFQNALWQWNYLALIV